LVNPQKKQWLIKKNSGLIMTLSLKLPSDIGLPIYRSMPLQPYLQRPKHPVQSFNRAPRTAAPRA
jgi:hypothetical protein